MHISMKTTQGISLYSYHYLKPEKAPCFSYYLFCFVFNKVGEQEGGTCSAQRRAGRLEVDQIMYSHVSSCKNDKIFKK
jgi:hypothetical protein